MKPSKYVLVILGTALILLVGYPFSAQEKPEVLEPANSNEARLNGLQPPDQVMDAIGVKPGMTVAEIGAGRGRYVVQLAVRVGEKGQVYAEDINLRSLQYLEKRCERGGLNNVTTILGEETEPRLPEGELDLIFVISSYHHFSDPIALMRNARSALKPTGIVAIGEWLPRNSNSTECRTPEQIEGEMKKAGYSLERIEKFLEKNNMYIYIFKPAT
jgi:ubiquinone/menaquinone biosynthesis C-methylase UbiE